MTGTQGALTPAQTLSRQERESTSLRQEHTVCQKLESWEGFFGLLLVGVIVYFSLGFDQQTCEVCMDFQGRTQCRTAWE